MNRYWLLAATILATVAMVAAQGNGQGRGRGAVGGPPWQSEEAVAIHQQVHQAMTELAALQAADPQDAAAIEAKQAELDGLRQRFDAQRDAERPDPAPCVTGAGGAGPPWQSEATAALHEQLKQAERDRVALRAAEPQDANAILAKSAEIEALRSKLREQRAMEHPIPGQGQGRGMQRGQGQGQGRGMQRGQGQGRGMQRGQGQGQGRGMQRGQGRRCDRR